MPKNIKGSRVTDGAVPNYTTNTVKKPSTSAVNARNIRRPGQPGSK